MRIQTNKLRGTQMKSGFTLVEILIVVVILGILAAIVIPQFTDAATEAQISSLTTDLQTVRAQLELYKIQHNDAMPDTTDSDSFWACLKNKTTKAGVVDNTNGTCGPYLQKEPKNPFNESSTVEIEDGSTNLGGGVAGNTGWHLNTTDNSFHADTDGHTTY
jgi:general secretion pathway protein G